MSQMFKIHRGPPVFHDSVYRLKHSLYPDKCSEVGVCSQVRSTALQQSDGVARLHLSGSSRGRLRVAATFQVTVVSRSENKFESWVRSVIVIHVRTDP